LSMDETYRRIFFIFIVFVSVHLFFVLSN